jgi:hypothetical protein
VKSPLPTTFPPDLPKILAHVGQPAFPAMFLQLTRGLPFR